MNQEIHTFPLFQLAQFSQLVSDLGVNPAGYVDSYNPYSGHWEQQPISTVRAVESEQRLLYRIRRNFVEGLTEAECPGIRDELNLQVRPPASSTSTPTVTGKRPAPDRNADNQTTKYFRTDHAGNSAPGQSYVTPLNVQHYTSTPGPSHNYPTPPTYPLTLSTKSSSPTSSYSYGSPAKEPSTPTTSSSSLVNNGFPHHPHPPLKRWPNDYSVSEISAGFKDMDGMITQQPTTTQRAAFEKVFGCRYVKSTVCRHRGVWRRADESTKSCYELMGHDEHAMWGEFVKQVEGRRKSDGQTSTAAAAASSRHHSMMEIQFAPIMQMMPGHHLSNVGSPAVVGQSPGDGSASDYQTAGGAEDVSVGPQLPDIDEPVMGSLGPPPPGHMH